MSSQIIVTLRYTDALKSIAFLESAFGFKQQVVYKNEKGEVAHAQVTFGNSMIMIGTKADTDFDDFIATPNELNGKNTITPYIIIDGIDAHYEQAKSVDAEIVIELRQEEYGGKYYAAKDLEGYLWNFGSYDPWKEQQS